MAQEKKREQRKQQKPRERGGGAGDRQPGTLKIHLKCDWGGRVNSRAESLKIEKNLPPKEKAVIAQQRNNQSIGTKKLLERKMKILRGEKLGGRGKDQLFGSQEKQNQKINVT